MSQAFLDLKKAAGCKSLVKHVKLRPPSETPFFKAEKEREGGREGTKRLQRATVWWEWLRGGVGVTAVFSYDCHCQCEQAAQHWRL